MLNTDISLRSIEKFFLLTTLIFLEVIIFAIDQMIGSGISFRPLFVVPIILSALFVNSISTIFFVIISTLLHVESYRLSDFGSEELFNYPPNIIVLLINYSIISIIVMQSIKYRDKLIKLKNIIISNKIDNTSNNTK